MRKGGRGSLGEALRFRFGGFESRVVFVPNLEPALAPGSRGALLLVDAGLQRLRGRELPVPPGAGLVEVAQGEASKSWERAREILQAALERALERDATMIGVGGGVVCDLAAFCASVYMRGCRLILVPTTLLAMVDAALGGKTGLNFGGFKNLVGTFYPAAEIRIWPGALASLPERELLSGLAEAIKTALIGDPELLALLDRARRQLLSRDLDLLEGVARRCLTVKGRVVEKDFREGGARAVLNLGHTFAHALEAVAGLGEWSHGEAVAWGMAQALRLGTRLGITPPEHAQRVVALLDSYGYRTAAGVGVDPRRLVAAMSADKKRRDGDLRLVLQRGIGDTVVQAVEEAIVLKCLQDG